MMGKFARGGMKGLMRQMGGAMKGMGGRGFPGRWRHGVAVGAPTASMLGFRRWSRRQSNLRSRCGRAG